MVRFINTLAKFFMFFVFFPFATTAGQDYALETEPMKDYPPNQQYDRTESQINAITELLQLFDQQTIKKTFNKWISQNQMLHIPSIIINSKNITFTKFIPDEDIVPISSVHLIHGDYDSYLIFDFIPPFKVMQVDGTVELLSSENNSSCQIAFNFTFKQAQISINFQNIYMTSTFLKQNFTYVECDEKSCKNIYEEHHPQSIYDDVEGAMTNLMIERIQLMKRTVFQSISSKWIHPDKNSYASREKYFSRFKPHIDTNTFSWLLDSNDIIINGLKNFDNLVIMYQINGEGETRYTLTFKDVKIRWIIAPMTVMQLSFDIREFQIIGSIQNPDDFLVIKLSGILEVSDRDYTAEIDEKLVGTLEKQIAKGIQQSIQKIRCDGTKDFINVMREILRPFDEELFEKTLVNPKKTDENNFSFGTVSIFKLDIEIFHLKNITRLHSDKLVVYGTLEYEKVNGRADILLSIINNKVHNVPVSVNLFIKEITIGISLKYSNSSDDVDVQINPNWSGADTTITITSSHYHLSMQERIQIGTQIFQFFIKIIENQIIDITKSTLRPIFDVDKNLFKSFTPNTDRSNNFDNQRQYFALIHDYWGDTKNFRFTEAVEITIEGFWNFNFIDAHYINGKLSIGGLQLENVTASITQLNNLRNTVTTNYTIDHFSLTINHNENEVFVNVTSSDQNVSNIIEKFESTVGRFIGYLIYSNSTKYPKYHAKLREFVHKTMNKRLLDGGTSVHDVSSQFAAVFVHILHDKENSLHFSFEDRDLTSIASNNEYISNETSHRIEPVNVIQFFDRNRLMLEIVESKIQEEISVFYSNNSLSTNNVEERIVMNGKVQVRTSHFYIMVLVSFAISNNLALNVNDNYYNETVRKIYIDDENIEDIHEPIESKPIEKNDRFDPSDTTMKTALALLTSSFLRGRLNEIPLIHNFNRLHSGSFILQEESYYSIVGTVNYPSQLFSTYYIRLYGLRNFKSLRTVQSKTAIEFETTMTNLTAHIIWNHYSDDYIRKTPRMSILQIREITLCAKISFTKRLIFTEKSRLLFSDQEQSTIEKRVEAKVKLIIMNEIQQAIQQEYNKITSN